MKRTNSKKVNETVKAYIMEHFKNYQKENAPYYSGDLEQFKNLNTEDYTEVCNAILTIFFVEKLKHNNRWQAGRLTRQDAFIDWMQGLCSAVNSDYYYNVSAVDLLGSWLEETEAEKALYTEEQAEKQITQILYRELNRNATRTGILY